MSVKQYDLFEDTLEQKIHRLERRMVSVHKELQWLRNVAEMYTKVRKTDISPSRSSQIVMFE